MKFCERCNGSLPKTQKVVHDRHRRWLCQPCHELELQEQKERAEAHLREVHERGGRTKQVNWAAIVGASIGAIVLLGLVWKHRSEVASAQTSVEHARTAYYRLKDAPLAERVAAMTLSEREDWESARLEELADSAGWDPKLHSSVKAAIHDELRIWRPNFPTRFLIGSREAPVVLVRSDWHGLSDSEQLALVADLDRVLGVLVEREIAWTLRDAGVAVGGRRVGEGGLWGSKSDPSFSTASALND